MAAITKTTELVITREDSTRIIIVTPNRMIAIEDTELFEFSTEHFDEDSHRIIKSN
jgi:hypothetical protein